jgi:fatty acid hydroxylase family protein
MTVEVNPERWLSDPRRNEFRKAMVAAIPGWYSPWAHLAFPTLFGLSVVALCLRSIEGLRTWELLLVPLFWVLNNAGEWRVHRDLLHKRHPLGPILYERHTPLHHRMYTTEQMAIRDLREFRLVLLPSWGIVLLAIGVSVPAAVLWLCGLKNVAMLYVAVDLLYTLSYEWLHLSYHLPPESRVGRMRLVRVLRRHHATHHDPRLMQRYNFNVTVPFWDWVRGTIAPSGAREPVGRPGLRAGEQA